MYIFRYVERERYIYYITGVFRQSMQQPCIALLTKSKFDSFLSPPWPHYLKKGQVPIHPKVLTPQRLSSAHWPPPWPERESAVWL